MLPFASLGEGDEARLYAAGVTEEILTQLSRFKDLAVLGRETTRSVPATVDAGSIARELAARYALTGSLRISGPEVRVASRLVDTGTGTVLWAQTYEEDLRAKELFAIQEDIALRVATAVAQPYGVVFRSDLQRTANQPPDDLEAYACTLRFYVYRARAQSRGARAGLPVPGARGGPLSRLCHGLGHDFATRAWTRTASPSTQGPASPVRSTGHCRRRAGPSTWTPTTPAPCRL